MPRRFKKIEKAIEKIIGKSEIESVSSNENENEIIENEIDDDDELENIVHNSDFILERIFIKNKKRGYPFYFFLLTIFVYSGFRTRRHRDLF